MGGKRPLFFKSKKNLLSLLFLGTSDLGGLLVIFDIC